MIPLIRFHIHNSIRFSHNSKFLLMKKYVITIHCIPNFGSVFQSYGLVEYLRRQGNDVEIIDYRPHYYQNGRDALKSYVAKLINLRSFVEQTNKYNEFIRKELSLTPKVYYNLNDLMSFNEQEGVFISGGDQIWNSFHPSGRDDAYKLTFLSNQKRFAFGSSMGRTSFSDDELKALASKVRNYSFIGLREQSSVPLLAKYLDVPIRHVVDPVLLLKKEDYMRFIGQKPFINEPYLLMYLSDKSDLLNNVVESISKEFGLKVVHVCGFRRKCNCDYFLKSTGPEELLNLIYYSQFIVSSSFHATLFSLLLEKQFCTLLPEVGTNTRIEDLLCFYGLENRIIRKDSDIENLNSMIEFDVVRGKLNEFAEASRTLLNKALQ